MPRAGKAPLTPGLHKQTLTFASAVIAQLPQLSEAEQQRYIGKPQLLARRLREAFTLPLESWAEARLEQERFYKEVLGLGVSLAGIRIPKAEGDLSLPLILSDKLIERFGEAPIEGLFQVAKLRFSSWKYADELLDTAIPTHERHPKNGSYAILVRDRIEADEENKNFSADDVKGKNLSTETILERILHELFHHWKTGGHLDVENWTLCSGSRDRGGGVPDANWGGDGFRVGWYDPTRRFPSLRARSVST